MACVLVIALGVATAGCKDSTKLVIEYSPAMEATPNVSQAVTVFEFTDERLDQVSIGKTAVKDLFGTVFTYYQSARPVGRVVTDAVVRNLEAQGFRVVRSSGWNLDAATLRNVTTDLAAGGVIKVFWVESGASSTQSATVNIHVVIADSLAKTVLWEGDLVGYETFALVTLGDSFKRRPKPDELLQKAFSTAIDELFYNPEIQRALNVPPRSMLGLVVHF